MCMTCVDKLPTFTEMYLHVELQDMCWSDWYHLIVRLLLQCLAVMITQEIMTYVIRGCGPPDLLHVSSISFAPNTFSIF